MSREELVVIDGPYGPLPGILHVPDAPTPLRCCVIMLSAGQLGRAGPQRLYVNAARHWAGCGIASLRLDLAGVGDSPLDNDQRHFDGHRPEEATAAVGYACDVLGYEAVFLQGLCAGARVALKGAAADARVAGVLAWSCPALSSSEGWPASPYEQPGATSAWSARDTLQTLARALLRLRFLRPAWWRERLQQGAHEARQVLRALRQLTRGAQAPRNPFLAAVDRLRADDRAFLFVYAERDAMEIGEFQECFPGIAAGANGTQGCHIVASATHTFSALDSQRELIDLSTHWLQQRLSTAQRA